MNESELRKLIDLCVSGEISPEQHQILQVELKSNPQARVAFREQLDLESALRTWASEGTSEAPKQHPKFGSSANRAPTQSKARSRVVWSVITVAVAILLLVVPWVWKSLSDSNADKNVVQQGPGGSDDGKTPHLVGVLRQRQDCEWDVRPAASAAHFAAGKLALSKGVAQLGFDSGTNVVLEAPCELVVLSPDSARLLSGNVFVNVSELSHGFTLETPEGMIVDEGTEYAVALDNESAEVHVFDGSVIWMPSVSKPSVEDRIEAGQAKRYLRTSPTKIKHIPFGQRQFVRQIEQELKERAGAALLAYDGFENLAGRLRRGRSGFGWSGGWDAAGRRRGKLAAIVDAPDDTVFGFSRSGRRLLSLQEGDDIRRRFEQPLGLSAGETYFISFLAERSAGAISTGQSLKISLEPDIPRRGHRRRQIVTFGVTTEGFPFVNSGSTITETASRMGEGEVCFVVLKLTINEAEVVPVMRVYDPGESVDAIEPSAWTVTGAHGNLLLNANSIRLTAGLNAVWRIDELQVGKSWRAVTTMNGSREESR